MNEKLPRHYPQLAEKDGAIDFEKYSMEYLVQIYIKQVAFYTHPEIWGDCLAGDRLEKTFKKFDKDGGGELDFQEVKALLQYHEVKYNKSDKTITDKDVEDFYADIDQDGDQEIAIDEWKHFMFRHLAAALVQGLRDYLFEQGFNVIDLDSSINSRLSKADRESFANAIMRR